MTHASILKNKTYFQKCLTDILATTFVMTQVLILACSTNTPIEEYDSGSAASATAASLCDGYARALCAGQETLSTDLMQVLGPCSPSACNNTDLAQISQDTVKTFVTVLHGEHNLTPLTLDAWIPNASPLVAQGTRHIFAGRDVAAVSEPLANFAATQPNLRTLLLQEIPGNDAHTDLKPGEKEVIDTRTNMCTFAEKAIAHARLLCTSVPLDSSNTGFSAFVPQDFDAMGFASYVCDQETTGSNLAKENACANAIQKCKTAAATDLSALCPEGRRAGVYLNCPSTCD